MNKQDMNLPGVDEETLQEFARLYGIIKRLREPDGCPWDLKQTDRSMRKSLIEEAYEAVSAIDAHNDGNIAEELGDLLLVILLIVRIKEQKECFSLFQVLEGISDKLIRRHPHVFGDSDGKNTAVKNDEEVVLQWDKIKREIEGKAHKESVLEGIPEAFSPLEKAFELQKKAAKYGFDWNDIAPMWGKLEEETNEFKEALKSGNAEEAEEELGDILFTIVNIGRFLKLDPTLALHRTNIKFIKRFMEIEKRLHSMGIPLDKAGLELMDSLWNSIKAEKKDNA